MNTTLRGTSLIAGAAGGENGTTFQAISPLNHQPLAPGFHEASLAEVNRALDAAATAFQVYRTVVPERRAEFLDAIAVEIELLGDALLERCHRETGLPLARLSGERVRTCGQLRLFAEVVREGSWVDARIDTALPARQPLPRPDLRRMLLPIGPVVVFGSSNFPFAFSVAGGDTASAFAAGCPVVVKAHRAHPGTSELVAGAIVRAIRRCGLPDGIFSLLHGSGATMGVAMVRHPATRAVGFTGSHTAGRALFDAAAARPSPIPVFAEMSSLNPVFLLPGALRERAPAIAQGFVASFTLGVGQFCTKPGLVFLRRGAEADAFLDLLRTAVGSAACGTMLTPGIREAFVTNRDQVAAVPGVNPLAVAGAAPRAERTEAQPSLALTTAEIFLREPAIATEAFGPFAVIIVAENDEELRRCAEHIEGQLTATVHLADADGATARPLFALLQQRAGRLVVNGFPTGVEVCPAMHHGGPYPATTDVRFTSVGTAALLRFARPVCFQNFPIGELPPELAPENPRRIMRLVNGQLTR